jgi:hypothetical protein
MPEADSVENSTTVTPTWNIARGLNRLFVVFTIGWYLFGGLVVWPKWANTIHARQEARQIFAATPNADGTQTAYLDEIETYPGPKSSEGIDLSAGIRPRKIDGLSPERYRAWQAALRKADNERALPITIFFLAVPIVVYAFGASLYWAGRGFRQEP